MRRSYNNKGRRKLRKSWSDYKDREDERHINMIKWGEATKKKDEEEGVYLLESGSLF